MRYANLMRLLLIVLMSSWSAFVAAADIDDLNSLLAKATSINAQFEQLTMDASGARVQESQGQLVVERPDRFRWQVATPFPQLVISDGKTVSIYDPDLEQLTVQSLDPRAGTTPALILSGNSEAIERDFSVKALAQDGEVTRFQLQPRAPDSLFESLELEFVNDHISAMQLVDSLGSRTRIDFSSVQTNIPIDAELFEMNVPEGTDIIEDLR
ncbi:outer membrane lipoprotein chaperone LolA [Aestuariirhabdus sp. Z084]|uniref:outer membrane lipoprotein chaperone LolA n=1 Tax=Aestuariirhabdus haliotis TaxID=2918751 RepID=UPI00201B4397|nr:outer membrane lipoprotein chaperone LolA [Aestuariirhabdus haliotis]MCL6414882.1 outer membrane lipoprotein chaperone LolA [Aestuariirhabdus haliotis]MCL6418814.1 outer membrane lipoprotein chaperone LolA [Aestuariirhabdus haliotis]